MSRLGIVCFIGTLLTLCGCGTTRWSDSARTATEQLLISDAIDRAVSRLDFRALAGKRVYFDTTYLKGTIDVDYLTSSLRQHAAASGCIVKTRQDEADYIAEIRSGAVGTDRHDVLFGVPATALPTGTPGVQAVLPELPLVKRTDQRAVAKIAIFAYNRTTGRPVWQSGIVPVESTAKDVWVFGAGPFKKGNIHKGTNFEKDKLPIPMVEPGQGEDLGMVSVASQAYFTEPVDAVEIARRESEREPAGKGDTRGTPPAPASSSAPPAAAPPPAGGPPVQSQGGFYPLSPKPQASTPTVSALPVQLPQFPSFTPLAPR